MAIAVNGTMIAVDDEGYLARQTDWSPLVATEMARSDDCVLSEDHWEVINILREYYEEHQIVPAMRVLTKEIAKKLGREKGNSRYLYDLYPSGPAKQASRYAGLPKPRSCI